MRKLLVAVGVALILSSCTTFNATPTVSSTTVTEATTNVAAAPIPVETSTTSTASQTPIPVTPSAPKVFVPTTGKYHAYSVKLKVPIYDYLDQQLPYSGYTRCNFSNFESLVYVSPNLLEDEAFGVIMHEYGHTLECRARWTDAQLKSNMGENVADLIGIAYGGFSTYRRPTTKIEESTALSLIKEFGVPLP